MRTRAEAISRQGRGTQGVAVMNIEGGDALAAIAQIDLDEDQPPSQEEVPEPDEAETDEPEADEPEPDEPEPDELEPDEPQPPVA